MDYKKFKVHHSRGRSDTNFYQDQTLLNGAYSGLKVLRVSIVNDLEQSSCSRKKSANFKSQSREASRTQNQSDSFNKSNSSYISNFGETGGEKVLTLVERVLLFKKELDNYFFDKRLQSLKFHLNNISSVIISAITYWQKQIIKECPILKNSYIVLILSNFSEIISTFIETKPQDFYREIKDAILNQWEKNRLRMKELFEKIEKYGNDENNKGEFGLKNSDIFHNINLEKNNYKENNNKYEESVKRIKKVDPATLKYLINKKKDIMHFISMMTQGVLFAISKLYYDMDYYSIIISSLIFKVFYGIMYYVDSNKDKNECLSDAEKLKQGKIFHIMNHFVNLALNFCKNSDKGKIISDNGGLNSMSKFMLNNFIQIVSKCKGIKVPKTIPKFKQESLSQKYFKNIYFKNYLQRYKKYHDNSLLRIFNLYYNSKIIFWKSVMLVAKSKDDKQDFKCRTCEKEISLNDIFIHLGCCKEQQSYYEKMKGFKIKLKHYVTNLVFYLAKLNINMTPINRKIFGKGGFLYKIIKLIPGCENDNDGVNFIKNLIKLYTFESRKPVNYYEINPDKIPYVISMSYFSLIIFLINKESNEAEQELTEILGGIFCTLLQIMMNSQFLLYIKKCKTKNSIIKNKKNIYLSLKMDNNFLLKNDINENKDNNDALDGDKITENKNIYDNYNSENNFKTTINKYKLKLSLNEQMIVNNSINTSKLRTNDRTLLNYKNKANKSFFLTELKPNKEEINSVEFFAQKSMSYVPLKKPFPQMTNKTSTTKINEILSSFHEENEHLSDNFPKLKKTENSERKLRVRYNKRSLSHFNTKDRRLSLRENSKFLRKSNFNLRPIGYRSVQMTKNNSSSNIFADSKLNNSSQKTDKERSDSSSILFCNNISNNANMVNISLFSENESSFESEANEKLNLSRVDSYLSRIDSNIHRLDSSISRGDSYDNNKNEENNGEGKNDYFLNSHQNFQLGYRGNQTKKLNNNKLSLFSSKSPPKITNKNLNNLSTSNNSKNIKPTLTSFKKSNKENEEENNSSDNNNSSCDIDNSNSKSNSNIVIHCEEEDENDDNNIEKVLEKEKIKERKESDADFFLEKAKSRKLGEDENLDNYLDLDNPRDEDDIIFRETNFEEVLPKILYIDPSNQKNLDINQIAELFSELMEGCEEKFDISVDQSSNNKNNILIDNFKEDKEIISKRKKLSVKFKTDNVSSNNININVIKAPNEKKNGKEKEDENEIIRTSKFKLILPIAKGGYGSVGLYKKLSTSDTYAIKTVDIDYMKEKKLSASLKIEQNILKEINNDYVVNSYYIFQDKKYYYFVMEYVPGGDVFTLLSKNNLPKRTIQLIVAETILAVNYLHSIHIIHHDIKPENILITLRGHFKLSDFGLSKSLQENEEDESMEEHVKNLINFVQFRNLDSNTSLLEDDDKNKDAVGTLNYMAPELFTDKYPQGGGVDYWAIGVLIFDLYSYSLPFEAKTQEETRENIIGLKIDWDKLINDDVKKVYGNIDAAVDLIKKFLKEDPKERWGDKNLDEIKKHKFFENFNWDDVQGIRNDAIKEYVKERVKENNNKIKQLNLRNKDKKDRRSDDKENKALDGYPEMIEINLTENDERSFFTERLDNLTKKNNEIVKKKFHKEVNIEENISDIMLLDLE